MRWRVNQVAVAAVTAMVIVAGCTSTVSGTARRAQPGVPDPNRSYGYVDDRCGLLLDASIQETLGAEHVATITESDVERHKAFLARRDTTGAACSATAAAGTGVLSWWVQFRGTSGGGDPCQDAEKLLSA